ncbi:sorbosone dehydrogenase family protein [bacterium]|nr:sorbosone dehydrogenase family protein [bacterium]
MILLFIGCGEDGVTVAQNGDLRLPAGFSIEEYAAAPNARSMVLGDEGTLFVGTRSDGRVFALTDDDGDGFHDTRHTIASGLNMPNGVAFKDGALYVAEVSRVMRYSDIEANLDNVPEPEVIRDDFPTDQSHGWKYIAFGPDGKLYVPVGAPCNICDPDDAIYATITRMDADGSNREIVAHGIRNTVGFDWHPDTGELWFTDNGRDWLGDDLPPDELNRVEVVGQHFGYPYVHGDGIEDPEFHELMPDTVEWTAPERELGPHVAALGVDFYEGAMFPREYRNQLFVAEHGSWNRSEKIGYRVMLVRLEDNHAVSYEPFVTGWLDSDGSVSGRPVDLIELPDGSLLVSDDAAGRIYRITYE